MSNYRRYARIGERTRRTPPRKCRTWRAPTSNLGRRRFSRYEPAELNGVCHAHRASCSSRARISALAQETSQAGRGHRRLPECLHRCGDSTITFMRGRGIDHFEGPAGSAGGHAPAFRAFAPGRDWQGARGSAWRRMADVSRSASATRAGIALNTTLLLPDQPLGRPITGFLADVIHGTRRELTGYLGSVHYGGQLRSSRQPGASRTAGWSKVGAARATISRWPAAGVRAGAQRPAQAPGSTCSPRRNEQAQSSPSAFATPARGTILIAASRRARAQRHSLART